MGANAIWFHSLEIRMKTVLTFKVEIQFKYDPASRFTLLRYASQIHSNNNLKPTGQVSLSPLWSRQSRQLHVADGTGCVINE